MARCMEVSASWLGRWWFESPCQGNILLTLCMVFDLFPRPVLFRFSWPSKILLFDRKISEVRLFTQRR